MPKAIVLTTPPTPSLVLDHPFPPLRDGCIRVQVISVALNPTDWKAGHRSPAGVAVGCDYAGIVEEVGPGVTKPFRVGDRVCGSVFGCNPKYPAEGAFAEYGVAIADTQMAIPDRLGFQEAATLGVGIITVGQALYQSLKMAPPEAPLTQPQPILIYGGSSATGTLAIQYAKLSGYTVLTTCSPGNFELVKGLGADRVYDYKDPGAAEAIREDTADGLVLVLDTISLESSAEFCGRAISSRGGDYSALNNVNVPREDVRSRFTLGYTVSGEEYNFRGMVIPPKPEDRIFASEFVDRASGLLAEGKVRPHPLDVRAGGLRGVLEGLKEMQEGRVSGRKLVYNVADTE
ncbi:GroES-like protein [Aspergillus heteromorphus CBS 117.55]|uniref:GroES-like protein n=1 Tax=Aspergillus heteromorphus CBS 117.55 TaxID=1448321 RepID=A0A317WHK2_9EURO|nr:GroES-like protein [Aspergillus heteromorphus CBS 117.55]PWY85926.1 GroES-like protein [Aspergillus heteromorphus CBS 117.55]